MDCRLLEVALELVKDLEESHPGLDIKIAVQLPYMNNQVAASDDPQDVFIQLLGELPIDLLAEIDILRFHALTLDLSDASNFENWFSDEIARASKVINGARLAVGGLEPVEVQAHSIYISRYVPGLEATIAWDGFDMKFRNNTPYGVFITAESNETSMTVRMYSTRIYTTIDAEVGERYGITPNRKIYNESPQCSAQTGGPGFTVDVDRVFYEGDVEVAASHALPHDGRLHRFQFDRIAKLAAQDLAGDMGGGDAVVPAVYIADLQAGFVRRHGGAHAQGQGSNAEALQTQILQITHRCTPSVRVAVLLRYWRVLIAGLAG